MYHAAPDPNYPRQPGEIRDMQDLRKMIDGYDCGIAYMDGHIGRVLDALEKKGVPFEDLAIIVTSDHGENQGEFGIYGEHATADHPTCHIPMLIKWPGCKQGRVDEGLHYNLDLAPTVADLLGKRPKPTWDGQSYAPSLLDGKDAPRDFLVLSQCSHVCQRSVRFGDYLYVRTYHDGYHLFPQEMLFDLEKDPWQQQDLAEGRPEICAEGARHLLDWHDGMLQSMRYETDPLWTVMREGGPMHARGFLRNYCKRLEETERGWAVPELKRRHPSEFREKG
ncbi:sulfatase-like hydrolase/transferase, partial [bacterium]|nr:sulfatase-like hydrolase/transferase [bacterium]